MQGIFVNFERPKSKKAVREAVAACGNVTLEATSFFGNEYDGPVRNAPDGTYYFVGPCPHTKRNFYGQVIKAGDKVVVK